MAKGDGFMDEFAAFDGSFKVARERLQLEVKREARALAEEWVRAETERLEEEHERGLDLLKDEVNRLRADNDALRSRLRQARNLVAEEIG